MSKLNTVRAMIKIVKHMEWFAFGNLPGRRHNSLHFVPMDSEGDHKEPKYQGLSVAAFGCILGSPSLKKKHKMAHPYSKNSLEGRHKDSIVLTEHNKQNQASRFQTSLELCQIRPKLNVELAI